MRDESECGEDDDAAEDGGGAVGEGDDDGVAVAVPVELGVGGHGQQAAARRAQAEDDCKDDKNAGRANERSLGCVNAHPADRGSYMGWWYSLKLGPTL